MPSRFLSACLHPARAALLLAVALAGLTVLSACSSRMSDDATASPAASHNGGDAASQERPVALVIHGGAGTILPGRMSAEQEEAYRAALQEALDAGYAILTAGGSSLDAVEAAITTMELSPLFNAGRGAVFTSEDTVELDASVMDGATRAAGALTGVTRVKHPIRLARAIMEQSPHVMMAGRGAETFAEAQGLEMVENSFFYTDRRRNQARRGRADGPSGGDGAPTYYPGLLDDGDDPASAETPSVAPHPTDPGDKFGTVGAVALDRDGNLAAGTSTGGMTNKRFGRVGDSPIIGAGTYADNATCGVSATGHGEYFIRGVVAHDIAARMKHGGATVTEAARAVIHDVLPNLGEGGTGGVIAMDAEGTIAMPFNTPGMYRASIAPDGTTTIQFFGEDEPNRAAE
jgi:beta-aspartyl-peptidase (threonine type)